MAENINPNYDPANLETTGTLYNTQIPELADDANIQEALRLYHYGTTTAPATNAEIIGNSVAGHLKQIKTDITALSSIGIGSSFNSSEPTSVVNGYIWVDADSVAPVFDTDSLSAIYSPVEPVDNLNDGMLWVDSSQDPLELYVYNGSAWASVNISGTASTYTPPNSVYIDYQTTSDFTQNVADLAPLTYSDGTTDLVAEITVSTGFTKALIELHGNIQTSTATDEEAYLMVQRSTDGGVTWNDVKNIQVSALEEENAVLQNIYQPFTRKVLDTHGVSAGGTVQYRFINNTAAVIGGNPNTIRQFFTDVSSLLIVEEVA